jgi:triacylglycerol lipase
MISFWLRCALAVFAVALLAQFTAPDPTVGLLCLIGAFLALHFAVVAVSFAVSRRHAFKAPPELVPDISAAVLIFLREWLAHLVLFGLIQPFEQLWIGADALDRSAPGRVPVLLIHGYCCNRGAWWWLHKKLTAAGFIVATINLEPPFGGIDEFADPLKSRIEALCADTGAGQVVLVCHSMGGLAARAYLRKHGPIRVAKLVTLASPHHGTWLARYGPGQNAREMEPDSTWIRAIGVAEPGVPMLSVWTPTDNFVAPQDSSRLAGACEKIVPALSHLAMLFSPAVLEVLIGELAHPNLAHR